MASNVPNDAMHLSNQYRYKVQPPMQMPSPPTAGGGSSTSFKDATRDRLSVLDEVAYQQLRLKRLEQRVVPRDTSHHVHPWETLNHTPFIPSSSTSGPLSRSKKTTDGRTVRELLFTRREEHTNAAKWEQEQRRSQFRILSEEAILRTNTRMVDTRTNDHNTQWLREQQKPHIPGQTRVQSHATDTNISSIACNSNQINYSPNTVAAAVVDKIGSHLNDKTPEIQRLRRQALNTLTRLTERIAVVQSDDYGNDLVSVKEMLRKNKQAEHDLDTLEEVVNLLFEVAALLPSTTESDQIYAVLLDLEDHWLYLSKTVKDHTYKLIKSFEAHLFANCRDLIMWFNDSRKRMASAQLVEDVDGAETLLQYHHEHKREIDARADHFRSIVDVVVQLELITDNDLIVTEAQDELETLDYERTALLDAWEDRLLRYELCIEANLFYRDVELATVRLSKQETLMDNNELSASLTSLDAQLENHKYLMESLAAEEATIKSLYDSSMELTEAHHFDSRKINKRMFELLQRRSLFLVQVANRQKVLQSRKLLELPTNNFQESRPVITSQSESRHNKSEHLLVHPLWATANEAESLTRDGEPPVANTVRDEDDWCQEKVNERELLVLPTGQKNFAANYSIGKQHSDNNYNPSTLIRGHQIKPNETMEKDLDVDPLSDGNKP